MFEGWLGEPFYGLEQAKAEDSWKKWNALADAIVGKGGKRIKGRPGDHAAKIKLDDVRARTRSQARSASRPKTMFGATSCIRMSS